MASVSRTIVGHSLDELAAALDRMERATPVGGYCRVQLCTNSLPSKQDCDLAWAKVTLTGHTMTKPVAQMIDGVSVTTFGLRVQSPYQKYQLQLLIPLIVPLMIGGLIVFGITRSADVNTLVMPILLVVGGVVILGLVLARKPVQSYIEQGHAIKFLTAGTPSMDARNLGRRDFFMRECLKTKSMKECALEYDRKYGITPLNPAVTPNYYTSNPPNILNYEGHQYQIHMTMKTRQEADGEARDLRDHGDSTRVVPWEGGYAIYRWNADWLASTEDAEHLLRRLQKEVKDLERKAKEYDKIPLDAKFFVISEGNPYNKAYNAKMTEYMKYVRLVRAGGGLQHRYKGPTYSNMNYRPSVIRDEVSPKALAA